MYWDPAGLGFVFAHPLEAADLKSSVDVDGKKLYGRLAGVAKCTADWDAQILYDTADKTSVDWGLRKLKDAADKASANWDGRDLYDDAGTVTCSWKGTNGAFAVTKQTHATAVYTTDGGHTVSLSNGTNAITASGNISVGGNITTTSSGNLTIDGDATFNNAIKSGSSAGITGSITYLKTLGGSTGTLTFTHGIITGST